MGLISRRFGIFCTKAVVKACSWENRKEKYSIMISRITKFKLPSNLKRINSPLIYSILLLSTRNLYQTLLSNFYKAKTKIPTPKATKLAKTTVQPQDQRSWDQNSWFTSTLIHKTGHAWLESFQKLSWVSAFKFTCARCVIYKAGSLQWVQYETIVT